LDGGGRLAQLNLILLQFKDTEFRRFKNEFVKLSGCDPDDPEELRFKNLIGKEKGMGDDYETRKKDKADAAKYASNHDGQYQGRSMTALAALQPKT